VTAPSDFAEFAGKRFGVTRAKVRRAYLLIAIPAVVVGILYFAIFHSLGMAVGPAPFLGTLVAFVAAVLIVRRQQRRKQRPGGLR
jgi:hypothetical protein